MDVLLFSYGTLRQPEVQLATFGRLLDGRDAAIAGHRLEWLTITDPHVIATSGSDRHPLLVPAESGETVSSVAGTVFSITPEELAAADEYEVDDYTRIEVELDSGESAWVYVFAG
ncbi:gamma-glutamylcyclotransferase [Herbiconiux moechotypicola]|uniref:Gamma-glutamylcyclotransferase n=1 Tax=Herbiconiux moechotypicola TaxID=637393 RepID=A0ABN3E508_9MICO|nr:gamma-glutamylcyclotransferase family protein [Herbiconiux moechotypicola]MCS5731643.1 gamma-glutamylcyclotransferase [Herbiconiux moechotypicola]